jgi:hypothetical protein
VLDESYRKAGKMDSDCFAPMLDPVHSKLLKIIRGYLLEGTQSTKSIRTELYKLNVYGTPMTFITLHFDATFPSRQRVILQTSRRYSEGQKDVWLTCDCLSDPP